MPKSGESLKEIDREWTKANIQQGLISGEGLINAVRDPVYRMEDGEEVCVDEGVTDKSTLDVRSRVCIAHITQEELRRNLTATELANGFANRFLWVCARRFKLLPEGGTSRPLSDIPTAQKTQGSE